MRQFIKRALQKLNVLTPEQIQDVFLSATTEIARLETVLDSLSVGILVCDTGHNLILANKYALRLLPINSFEQEREPVWNVIGDKKVAAFLETTLESGDKAEEWEFNAELGGRTRQFSLSVWPLVQKRQVTGSLIHVADITEKRSREARMRRMESLASLTTLAAGVAHEIKNPLGSLSIHVQLIQKALRACHAETDGKSADGKSAGGRSGKNKKNSGCRTHLDSMDRYINVINEEIERLNQIVVDFLFAVRPMDLDLRLKNINILLSELAEFVSYELKAAKIECVIDLAQNLPAINFDERYMKQVFLNLIKNAIAAMPDGGKLFIKTETNDSDICIIVADTGTGIPEENLVKIFEPYYTTKETGTGLGLTLVFKIIREHNGEINVHSVMGEGTVFIITMPVPQKETRLLEAPDEV
ncbi:MAG: ATP-binding protein [Treponema sp.]|nr:ATP-binding protein [Treponema sp.]